jgi:hypothetical protein
MTLPDGERVKMEGNIPAMGEVEKDGVKFKVDQRSSGSWWEKILPQKVEVNK